ncbi:GAF and ANTAR domain-containing protein [Crossiella sp. CA-258035]|uniref:GAF and ANTAR domain-containing protein n=1 Tax=Crossiella sp. CA-258035 TaxID=2981138 RepID=UPI0024BC2981|nr:GAF and ANTAR domain-containing protein [Crossiella sp. CA-258035]WHT16147.1 GAF and ANTAR domain-containing protein [Crossiella sp. CA-258035]
MTDVGPDRHRDILVMIDEIASSDREPINVSHVCLACRDRLTAVGVAVYLVGTVQPLEVVGPVGDEMAELQVTLGEGPVSEAVRQNQPVFVPQLANAWSSKRWPAFAPAALAAGAAAVFVIPLTLGAIALGALEICRDVDGPLSRDELADALLCADTVTTLLLSRPAAPAAEAGELSHAEPEGRWAVVHQATGMMSVQLDTDLGQAFLRLRAHAYLTGRRLSEVAADVVERRLRFTPETHEKKR